MNGERERNRPDLLPGDLAGCLQGWRLGRAIEVMKRVDRPGYDAAAALGAWSGIDPNTAGDQDLAADIWAKAQKDPQKWRAIFESLRDATYQVLTQGRAVNPTKKALAWLFAGAQAGREIGEDLGLIEPRQDDRLNEPFHEYKNLYHKM